MKIMERGPVIPLTRAALGYECCSCMKVSGGMSTRRILDDEQFLERFHRIVGREINECFDNMETSERLTVGEEDSKDGQRSILIKKNVVRSFLPLLYSLSLQFAAVVLGECLYYDCKHTYISLRPYPERKTAKKRRTRCYVHRCCRC